MIQTLHSFFRGRSGRSRHWSRWLALFCLICFLAFSFHFLEHIMEPDAAGEANCMACLLAAQLYLAAVFLFLLFVSFPTFSIPDFHPQIPSWNLTSIHLRAPPAILSLA